MKRENSHFSTWLELNWTVGLRKHLFILLLLFIMSGLWFLLKAQFVTAIHVTVFLFPVSLKKVIVVIGTMVLPRDISLEMLFKSSIISEAFQNRMKCIKTNDAVHFSISLGWAFHSLFVSLSHKDQPSKAHTYTRAQHVILDKV